MRYQITIMVDAPHRYIVENLTNEIEDAVSESAGGLTNVSVHTREIPAYDL